MRGTTPRIYFRLKAPPDQHKEIWVTGAQNGKIIVDKTIRDVQWDGERAFVQLTQEETLQMQEKTVISFQVRAKTLDNNAYKTNIWVTYPSGLIKDGVI